MYCSGYFYFFVSEDVLGILYDAKSQTVLFLRWWTQEKLSFCFNDLTILLLQYFFSWVSCRLLRETDNFSHSFSPPPSWEFIRCVLLSLRFVIFFFFPPPVARRHRTRYGKQTALYGRYHSNCLILWFALEIFRYLVRFYLL